VPADLRERIFYPFFTTKERGSGVGLAMAQKIVASHSGSLSLELDMAAGAHFRVRLPLEGDSAGEHSSRTAERRIEQADRRAGTRR